MADSTKSRLSEKLTEESQHRLSSKFLSAIAVFSAGLLTPAAAQVTQRVSVDSGGTQATGGSSGLPSISADGRCVAFQSVATNLVAGDTNGPCEVET